MPIEPGTLCSIALTYIIITSLYFLIGYTAQLQPCDQPTGINRILKPALYGAVDHLFTAKICAQLGISLANNNSDVSSVDGAI